MLGDGEVPLNKVCGHMPLKLWCILSRPEKLVLVSSCILFPSTEHANKDKAKERDREEREKKVKDREREKEKKKHKVVNEIKRENGEVKQPIKGWWKYVHVDQLKVFLFMSMSVKQSKTKKRCLK